jgi:hypothetical protein
MVFVGKHFRVCSNNKQATVACGTHGTVVKVDCNPNQPRKAKYTILWDNYNVGLFAYRDEFQVLYQNSKEIYQGYTQRIDAERSKKRKERKNVFTSFWKTLDDENLWHHFHAVQARNIVPVGESDPKSKLILETFRMIENEDRASPIMEQNVLLLPASGSEVRSLNSSTVLAGLFGVITDTKCVRGGATIFYILWKGYLHSINYTLNEFVVTKYAVLTEDGQDPNKSLKALALSLCEPLGVSVTSKLYCEKNSKVVFDNSRRPGHVVFNEF